MNVEDVQTLYAYNQWANRRLLSAARLLDAEDFARDLGTSHKSVKGTLTHMLLGEWRWIQSWRGESEQDVLAQGQSEWEQRFTDVAALEDQWTIVERDRQTFTDSLTDELLRNKLKERRGEFTLAHMMLHLANHSSFHRGQVVALLRQLGQTPPSTDFIVFLQKAGSKGAA